MTLTLPDSAVALDLTLVIDIGKSHAKLLFIDEEGAVRERQMRDNRSVASPLGYTALDLNGLADWITQALRASPHTSRCGHAIASTHGAAFVALGEEGVAWAPLDYEFEAVGQVDLGTHDAFSDTLSPELPRGLNAARQLAWMQQTHPQAWARTRTLLPYPQYWAWWLSGVAASERSSLGCHTHLWQVAHDRPSRLAELRGWAACFAPLRGAHEVLGGVHPARARDTGLPQACQVHVGVHDSNACLARYLHEHAAMTLVTSGTWTIVMASGAVVGRLRAEDDELGNVNVRGTQTPTARFMGGREFAALCGSAPPEAGNESVLQDLLVRGARVQPAFSAQGGPYRDRTGRILVDGVAYALSEWGAVASDAERATLASLYLAQMCAERITRLGGASPVIVEGPMADNPLAMRCLAVLLQGHPVFAGPTELEGTAAGAWALTRWGSGRPGRESIELRPVGASATWAETLQACHARWCQEL